MSKKKEEPVQEQILENIPQEPTQPEPEDTVPENQSLLTELEALKSAAAAQDDKFLRLAAEYDNYRKRTAKEKESVWAQVKADTAAEFLPVYDNLERALRQECADEAYKKGVEMTMTQFKEVFAKLGIAEIPALGQSFDPNLHNAVMHTQDENLAENTVCEVFQAGFQCGEKIIRCAMVKVAN